MSALGDELLSGVINVGSGVATGAVAGPLGMAIGGLTGVAKSVAPEIAKWLGASDATVAATEQAVATVTGQTDPSAALSALNSDPTMTAALRVQLADIASQQQAEENRAYEARQAAVLADFADARKRDIALTQSGKTNIRADVMITVTIVGIVGLLVVAIVGKLDGNSAIFALVSVIVGNLIKCYTDAFQFEFGSSRGSQTKSGTIADIAANPPLMKLLPKPVKIEAAD